MENKGRVGKKEITVKSTASNAKNLQIGNKSEYENSAAIVKVKNVSRSSPANSMIHQTHSSLSDVFTFVKVVDFCQELTSAERFVVDDTNTAYHVEWFPKVYA